LPEHFNRLYCLCWRGKPRWVERANEDETLEAGNPSRLGIMRFHPLTLDSGVKVSNPSSLYKHSRLTPESLRVTIESKEREE